MIKYLGIDWGEVRIGLALANSENKLATPFKVVKNIKEIDEIINNENINELIVGLPRGMSDGEVRSLRFKNFILALEKKILNREVKLRFVDERLSSVQADSLKNCSIKQSRDCVSAMIILQAYLDSYYD